jgi:hypothetical protein
METPEGMFPLATQTNMKITLAILALFAAGILGQSAFADNNGNCSCSNPSLALAVWQDGHGHEHIGYFQSSGLAYPNIVAPASIALTTDSGGVEAPVFVQDPANNPGGIKFVIGTNQHGDVMAAYVPTVSNFAPARQ